MRTVARKRPLLVLVAALLLAALLPAGCGGGEPEGARSIRMATTTSVENSGLLDALLPAFLEATGIRADVIAVGSGAAIRLGEEGEADVLFVHSPEAEEAFVAAGHGVDRTYVCRNDFVLVGPPDDPAGLRAAKGIPDALGRIASSQALFFSRDDDSGTHKKEIALWKAAGVDPAAACGDRYRGTGQGMGATLVIADESGGYTLADRGTYLAFRGKIGLGVVLEGDPLLDNPYHVIAVNPETHPGVRSAEAKRFVAWVASADAQHLIGELRVDGVSLFHPAFEAGM